MAKIDLVALKREIASISANKVKRKRSSEVSRSLSIQRREALRKILAQSGADVAALQEKISKNNRDFRDAVKDLRKTQSETSTNRRIVFQNNIAQRRAALEQFGSVPTAVVSSMVYLPEPFFISISPNSSLNFLKGTSIAPYDSRLKFLVPSTEYGTQVSCDFWFYWFNDSSLQVVVTNASTQTVFNGDVFGYVSAPSIWWYFNYEGLSFLSGTNIDLYQDATSVGGLLLEDQNFTLEAVHVDQQNNLSYEYDPVSVYTRGIVPPLIVPPQTGILISVSPSFFWNFVDEFGADDGQAGNWLSADFANDELDYFVQCSGVALEIQSPVISEPKV